MKAEQFPTKGKLGQDRIQEELNESANTIYPNL